jgi:Flp pilus assembly protein TadD
VVLALAGCERSGRADDQPTGSIDSAAWSQARSLPAGVRAALDSGNAAFRSGDFAAARVQYRRAAALGPEESAAWFGLMMVERRLGHAAAADSALARFQELAPGATLVEPADPRADTSRDGH